MTDFSSKNDGQIDQWIANFEARKETGATLYYELLEERAKRAQKRHSLDIEKSLSALKRAAIDGICITYGDLAKTSGVEWNKARHQMNGRHGHLDRLLEICHARGLPLLTAICVNKGGLEDGELEGNALAGFTEGARRIGRSVADERAFHHVSKDECWAWGKQQ
ncbi:hypothetical protein [Rhizobium leguminosarum]|uniref:hypothetical protein n=1 Tax=Rhizobium leguminosarum TaxID=384 RepID=UPI00103D0D98|nr:hypothetical protein [Rhizobium leguminosarum]NKK29593.1 hypothetical protein [Rhizobium leguminosarum bv. viciae]TBZ54226.1 hypothetical protein E0H42_14390 [Rhizobium leguminosarum bv. viciae]